MKGLGNLSSLLIAGIMASMVIVGMSSFFVDLASNPEYNLSVTNFETPVDEGGFGGFSTFNKSMEITERAKEIKDQVEVMTQTLGPVGVVIGVMFGAVQTVILTIGSISIFQNMVADAVGILRLPIWMETALFGIIIIIVVFTILSAVLKWRV